MKKSDALKQINEKLDAISKDLNNPKTGLKRINQRMDALWDQVVEVTGNVVEIKDTIKKIDSKIDQNN